MTTAALVLAGGGSSRFLGPQTKLLSCYRGQPLVSWAVAAALGAQLDKTLVVDGASDLAEIMPPGVTVLHNPAWAGGQATSLALGVNWCRERGYSAVVVGLGDQPLIVAESWRAVAAADSRLAIATYSGRRGHPVRLSREIWKLLPSSGDSGARDLMRCHPDWVREVPCLGDPADIDTAEDLHRWQ